MSKLSASALTNGVPSNPLKKYSQTGEEGVLLYLFDKLGTTNKYLVDFGAGDGTSLSNSKLLLDDYGWTGLRMDGKGTNDVKKEFITRENILGLFEKYDVPREFDLLSIDLDGNDYWILKEILTSYKPLVICAEMNGCCPVGVSQAIKYNAGHKYGGKSYYGASFEAIKRLCVDYIVVHNQLDLNVFLVHKDLVEGESIVGHTCPMYHHFQAGEWIVNPELVEPIVTYSPMQDDVSGTVAENATDEPTLLEQLKAEYEGLDKRSKEAKELKKRIKELEQ